MSLPGPVPPKLEAAFESLTPEAREALLPHLVGETSADFISSWFSRWGSPVGATTIKTYRRERGKK